MGDIVALVGELTAVRGQRDALMVEIERLRRENECLAAAMSSDGADACGALVVARAEIERLRADLLSAHGQLEEMSGEVARLRGLLQEALGDAD